MTLSKLTTPAAFALLALFAAAPALARAPAPAGAVVASTPSQPQRGMPCIEILLNGQGPYRFSIDTGAPGPVRIDPKVAETLGLKVVRQEDMDDGSGKNLYQTPVYAIGDLTLGGVSFGAQEGVAVDMGRWGSTVSGMFGMGVFKNYILVLDYAANVVSVETGALPPADNVTRFDVHIRPDGLIELPVEVAGQRATAVLDTGNVTSPGVSTPTALAQQVTRGEPRLSGKARTATNVVQLYTADLAGEVRIGQTALPITAINYPSAGGGDVNIGSGALRGARLKIDQASSRIEITWPNGKPAL